MQIGIVGLPNSTKTTIFNALTRSQVETTAYSTGQVETHTATVTVPDPRVDCLSTLFQPRKTTHARIQYNDIAGLRAGIGKDDGLNGPLLNIIAQSNALLHVVRAWTILQGASAAEAAGTIHSDLERGFIRAETVGYDDMVTAGSMTQARKRTSFVKSFHSQFWQVGRGQ